MECDSVFSFRGANWKYGLASSEGRLVIEPQFEEIILTRKNKFKEYFLFIDREKNTSGVVSARGEILVDDLPGLPQYHSEFHIDGCIVTYENFNFELVVYSACLEKLIGVYPKGKINLSPGVFVESHSNPKMRALPRFVISAPGWNEVLSFNAIGEKLTMDNRNDLMFCKTKYAYSFPRQYRMIQSSTSNVEVYQSYYPDYEIIEEYFNNEGSLSILARKDRKYGLLSSKGEVILPFEYQHIEFKEGLLIIKDGYRGIAECTGNILYPTMFTYVSLNDPEPGLILVDSYMGCRGYCDFEGNIFLPQDCLKSE